MTRRGYGISVLLASVLIAFGGCGSRTVYQGPRYGSEPPIAGVPTYSFVVYPIFSPEDLIVAYQPLIDYLNANLKDTRLDLEVSRDYGAFEKKYEARHPDFILANPWETIQAMETGYHVFAMAGTPEDFKGLFIVRKDSGIKEPVDLIGKAVSYPSRTALAACILPQYFLHRNGIDVNRDIENKYVGSQESSIMNAYLKLTAAGATRPTPWRAFQRDHPKEAAELEVAWETEPLINNSVMARSDVPDILRNRIQTLLTGLHESTDGRTILAGMEAARFFAKDDRFYDSARVFISRFEKEVRKIK